MSKAVLLSIKPKYCELIASGKKTVEVRKTKPKMETPFKCYIYCTKGKWYTDNKNKVHYGYGKVIGEFVCDEITCLGNISTDPWHHLLGCVHEHLKRLITEKACLTESELHKYGGKYAWHISDLVIYDKPKELSEFYTSCDVMQCEYCEWWGSVRVNADEFDMDCKSDWFMHKPLKRPPQSWCYVEKLEVA